MRPQRYDSLGQALVHGGHAYLYAGEGGVVEKLVYGLVVAFTLFACVCVCVCVLFYVCMVVCRYVSMWIPMSAWLILACK